MQSGPDEDGAIRDSSFCIVCLSRDSKFILDALLEIDSLVHATDRIQRKTKFYIDVRFRRGRVLFDSCPDLLKVGPYLMVQEKELVLTISSIATSSVESSGEQFVVEFV